MMKIRPLHDRVVVERLDEERKSAGGIVIPDNVAEKPDQGEVIAVGKGKILEDGKVRPLDVKIGDRILFGKFSGQAVKIEGTEYLVMREDDIMGVVAKEDQPIQEQNMSAKDVRFHESARHKILAGAHTLPD